MNKNVSRHCQMFLAGQSHSHLKTADLLETHPVKVYIIIKKRRQVRAIWMCQSHKAFFWNVLITLRRVVWNRLAFLLLYTVTCFWLHFLFWSLEYQSEKYRVNCQRWHRWWWFSRSVMSDSYVPMDCSPPDSCVRGILQARIQAWAATSFSRRSSWPRDRSHVSCTGSWILYHWVIREAYLCNQFTVITQWG